MIDTSRLLAGRYRLLEQIDSGGTAFIYKARDEITDRIIAVKILKPELTDNEEFILRFKKEVQASLHLKHANIIRAYDAGLDNGMYYIVMDLIKGRTLKNLIVSSGPLPVDYAVTVAKKVCLALEYAHAKGIVHRDIKPHNVMIDQTGEPFIADFGIAKNLTQSTITLEENNVMGSVHYFSPEQARGERADRRSDIYSVGILLYEMLTGKVPYDADTTVAIALKHINEQMPNAKDEMPSLPESLNKIILKAAQKDKHFRYKTAFTMYEDLQRCLLEPDGEYIKYTESKRAQQHIDESHLRRSKKSVKSIFSLVGVGVAIAAGIIIVVSILISYNFNQDVTVPGVINLTYEAAVERLESAGLYYDSMYENHNSEAGMVFSQTPIEGSAVKKDSVVSIVVSKGVGTGVMPDVTNITQEKAEEELRKVGVQSPVIERTVEGTAAIGFVVEQRPAQGEAIPEEGVTLVVKTSPDDEKLRLPDVTGLEVYEALQQLKAQGFATFFIVEEDSDLPAGEVIRQSPEKDSEQTAEQAVIIYVSRFHETPYTYSGQLRLDIREDRTTVTIAVADFVQDIPVYYIMASEAKAAGTQEMPVEAIVYLNSDMPEEIKHLVVFLNSTMEISRQVTFTKVVE